MVPGAADTGGATLPAAGQPAPTTATACVYISHLSIDERTARKASFIASVRDQITEAVELSSRPHLNSLLGHTALRVVEWLEENMHVDFAAELMHTEDDGKGRERVRELHSPIGFIRDYIRAARPSLSHVKLRCARNPACVVQRRCRSARLPPRLLPRRPSCLATRLATYM